MKDKTQPVTQPTYKSTAYKPATLEVIKGWKLPEDKISASNLAVSVMSFRRQYESAGIANFTSSFLEPVLKEIRAILEHKGYTVAMVEVGVGAGLKNYLIDVSKNGDTSPVLYVAHYDTVDRDTAFSKTRYGTKLTQQTTKTEERLYKSVIVEDNIASLDISDVVNTNAACLGADDGAGLAVILNLLQRGVLGGYCFTTGEECGGIGAREVTSDARGKAFLKQYKISVEIDRRGKDEIVYEQSAGECASLEFTQWLCDELKMGHKPSAFGSYTDVSDFAEFICENVNISAGYIGAHTTNEQVCLAYLDSLADSLSKVKWDITKIKRKENDYGFKKSGKNHYGFGVDLCGGWHKSSAYTQADDVKNYLALSDEDIDALKRICMVNDQFFNYVVAFSIETLADLDSICVDVFGFEWEDVRDHYIGGM